VLNSMRHLLRLLVLSSSRPSLVSNPGKLVALPGCQPTDHYRQHGGRGLQPLRDRSGSPSRSLAQRAGYRIAHSQENTSMLPVTWASELVPGRMSLSAAQIGASLCSQCRWRDQSPKMLSLACRKS
jgi:hypothetical protein